MIETVAQTDLIKSNISVEYHPLLTSELLALFSRIIENYQIDCFEGYRSNTVFMFYGPGLIRQRDILFCRKHSTDYEVFAFKCTEQNQHFKESKCYKVPCTEDGLCQAIESAYLYLKYD